MKLSLANRLNEIDAAWRNSNSFNTQEILGEICPIDDLEAQAELLAADSEWRWRKAGFSDIVPADPGCDWRDPRPRSVETYCVELPELAESLEGVRMLIESEFMARSRWGNPPMIAEFIERFPYVEGLEGLLRKCLDELSVIYVTVKSAADIDRSQVLTTEPVTLPVSTPLSIGRQAMTEPRDTLLPDRNRLIVVDNYQHGVSRQHVMVIRQAIELCWVANVSPLGQMKVNGQDLKPGGRKMCILPFSLSVGPKELRFFAK